MTWTPCLPITPVTDDPRPRVVYRTDMLRTLAENSRSVAFHAKKQRVHVADLPMQVLIKIRLDIAGIRREQESVWADSHMPRHLTSDVEIRMFTKERQASDDHVFQANLFHFGNVAGGGTPV